MAENIINSEGLTEKALESAEDFAVPEQADPEAAKRFGSLLAGEGEAPVLQDTFVAPLGESSGEALTLGDKILQGMQGLREHMDGRADQVKSYLGKDEALSMREMFQTQMAMTNLMVTEDYIGKIVSKSTQTFDTLLRNQ
ncbi:MAG: EscI/YscI/HrpB family type III secretion system inner rod protein [Endozoicomonas sp.]